MSGPGNMPSGATEEGEGAAQHRKTWKALMIEAYGRFHVVLEDERITHPGLTEYAIVDRVNSARGTFAWWWGAAGEIRETINSINAWSVRLHEWGAWNEVIRSYDAEEDRWDVLNHFVEPIAFFCMLQPSSFADRLALNSETLLHQANQSLFPEEPDRLDQDATAGRPLRRSDRRKQLVKLGQRWTYFGEFQQALHALDGADYRHVTRNYRDLASHSFSPRLMLGHVQRALRTYGPLQDLMKQPNGSYQHVDHPTKKAVSYAMVSLEPLALEETFAANFAEFQRAHHAMKCFIALVGAMCERMQQQVLKP